MCLLFERVFLFDFSERWSSSRTASSLLLLCGRIYALFTLTLPSDWRSQSPRGMAPVVQHGCSRLQTGTIPRSLPLHTVRQCLLQSSHVSHKGDDEKGFRPQPLRTVALVLADTRIALHAHTFVVGIGYRIDELGRREQDARMQSQMDTAPCYTLNAGAAQDMRRISRSLCRRAAKSALADQCGWSCVERNDVI